MAMAKKKLKIESVYELDMDREDMDLFDKRTTQYEMVGRIIMKWNRMELLIDELIGRTMFGQNEVTDRQFEVLDYMTQNMRMVTKVDAIKTLFDAGDEEVKQRVTALLKNVTDIRGRMNDVFYSLYLDNIDNEQEMLLMQKRNLNLREIKGELFNELQDLELALEIVYNDIWYFLVNQKE